MARRGNSVIGIDLGKHLFKGVLLQRKGDERFVLTSYATHEVPEQFSTPDEMAQGLKQLLRELGGGAKVCAIGVSDPDALLRIIEQPDTPIDLLRNALRFNGLAVLNQECKDFVLDCARVGTEVNAAHESRGEGGTAVALGGSAKETKYVVAGMLRPTIKQIAGACGKLRMPASSLQLAPICSFNAFEFAYPDTFANDAFLLLDLGHLQSSVVIGSHRELVLVRSIDYGGKDLNEALTAEGALDAHAARTLLQQSDPGMMDICRGSLMRLATEVRNSIGFFEGQHDHGLQRVFVSGGLARTETILQTLSDDLGLPCEIWDPLEMCEVALPAAKRQTLPHDFVSLNVACGAAFEYLRK